MSMKHNGLAKLLEECGEVSQVAGKMLQYPELQLSVDYRECHPDGTNLRECMEKELGDLLASINFCIERLNLNQATIHKRANQKELMFKLWNKEP